MKGELVARYCGGQGSIAHSNSPSMFGHPRGRGSSTLPRGVDFGPKKWSIAPPKRTMVLLARCLVVVSRSVHSYEEMEENTRLFHIGDAPTVEATVFHRFMNVPSGEGVLTVADLEFAMMSGEKNPYLPVRFRSQQGQLPIEPKSPDFEVKSISKENHAMSVPSFWCHYQKMVAKKAYSGLVPEDMKESSPMRALCSFGAFKCASQSYYTDCIFHINSVWINCNGTNELK